MQEPYTYRFRKRGHEYVDVVGDPESNLKYYAAIGHRPSNRSVSKSDSVTPRHFCGCTQCCGPTLELFGDFCCRAPFLLGFTCSDCFVQSAAMNNLVCTVADLNGSSDEKREVLRSRIVEILKRFRGYAPRYVGNAQKWPVPLCIQRKLEELFPGCDDDWISVEEPSPENVAMSASAVVELDNRGTKRKPATPHTETESQIRTDPGSAKRRLAL